METNVIHHKDNLELMRELPNKSIDLIYGDVLYGTGKDFGPFQDLPAKKDVIEEFYIPRIKEMYRLLKDTGSIYLQMDDKIDHWIKIIMDEVFGKDNFRNDIVWHYQTYQGQVKNYFPRKHDILLFYTKSDDWKFKLLYNDNYEDTVNYKRWEDYVVEGNKIKGANYPSQDSRFMAYYDKWVEEHGREPKDEDTILELSGYVIDSVWDIKAIDPKSELRLNFPTQKPEALLKRIIKASTKEGDLVVDFFCGSGTTLVVAEKLNRKWIGCDISEKAVEIARERVSEVQKELI